MLQGPKSYNDALAKRFERKKGDMGSSSTGVKDRGIFVAADFRNPRTDQELQVWQLFLYPCHLLTVCLICHLASIRTATGSVLQTQLPVLNTCAYELAALKLISLMQTPGLAPVCASSIMPQGALWVYMHMCVGLHA